MRLAEAGIMETLRKVDVDTLLIVPKPETCSG